MHVEQKEEAFYRNVAFLFDIRVEALRRLITGIPKTTNALRHCFCAVLLVGTAYTMYTNSSICTLILLKLEK